MSTDSIARQAAESCVLNWLQADLLSPYDAIERWRKLEPAVLHSDEPDSI